MDNTSIRMAKELKALANGLIADKRFSTNETKKQLVLAYTCTASDKQTCFSEARKEMKKVGAKVDKEFVNGHSTPEVLGHIDYRDDNEWYKYSQRLKQNGWKERDIL